MNIKETIKKLEAYNKWRRDNDCKYEMPNPKEIGLAIDKAIRELKKRVDED